MCCHFTSVDVRTWRRDHQHRPGRAAGAGTDRRRLTNPGQPHHLVPGVAGGVGGVVCCSMMVYDGVICIVSF